MAADHMVLGMQWWLRMRGHTPPVRLQSASVQAAAAALVSAREATLGDDRRLRLPPDRAPTTAAARLARGTERLLLCDLAARPGIPVTADERRARCDGLNIPATVMDGAVIALVAAGLVKTSAGGSVSATWRDHPTIDRWPAWLTREGALPPTGFQPGDRPTPSGSVADRSTNRATTSVTNDGPTSTAVGNRLTPSSTPTTPAPRQALDTGCPTKPPFQTVSVSRQATVGRPGDVSRLAPTSSPPTDNPTTPMVTTAVTTAVWTPPRKPTLVERTAGRILVGLATEGQPTSASTLLNRYLTKAQRTEFLPTLDALISADFVAVVGVGRDRRYQLTKPPTVDFDPAALAADAMAAVAAAS